MNKLSILVCLLLASLLGACGDASESLERSSTVVEPVVAPGEVRVGEPAPTFRVTTTSGDILDSEDLKGKVVVLNFWATWCGPCRLEMPELQAVHEAYGEDVRVIGVEIQTSGNREESAAFLREVGVTFPTVRDEGGLIERSYIQRPAWPTTVFIDEEGVVRFVQVGPMTREFLEEQLVALGL